MNLYSLPKVNLDQENTTGLFYDLEGEWGDLDLKVGTHQL